MKIYLIGIGMEGRRTLTKEAEQAIAESELLIGAKRMTEPFSDLQKQIFISWHSQEIAEMLISSQVQAASVLFSGDTGFFSGAEKLLSYLNRNEHEIQIISGISSLAYFCSRIQKSWECMKIITLHGVQNAVAVHVRQHEFCFFLLGGRMTAAKLCQRLCEYSLGDVKIYIGENLGYETERVFSGTAKEFLHHPEANLCVLVTENPDFCQYLPIGIDNAEFIRTQIPMTKREIRCAAVSALQIRKTDICWDIGSGTGSVSVEMAMQCPDGQVFALDKNPEAVRLTEQNAMKFSCDHLHAMYGNASEIPAEFQIPDKVFIGGASGQIPQVLKAVSGKKQNISVMITVVSLETLSEALHVFEVYHAECHVTQIAVTETRKIGTHTMMQAQNPVFLIKGELH